MEQITEGEIHAWADDNRPRVDEEREVYNRLCGNTLADPRKERGGITPRVEVGAAVKTFIREVKQATGSRVTDGQALSYFASLGVRTWLDRRANRDPQIGRER